MLQKFDKKKQIRYVYETNIGHTAQMIYYIKLKLTVTRNSQFNIIIEVEFVAPLNFTWEKIIKSIDEMLT